MLCVWLDEDKDGQPLPKRCRAGERRKRNSANVTGCCCFFFISSCIHYSL